jgi:pimeloyl-[acyl-carrier protein] methyl ester esterase
VIFVFPLLVRGWAEVKGLKMSSAGSCRIYTSTGMAFYSRGRGLPIVLLHGWCLNRRLWIYAEEALIAGFQVITPDLPGFGESDHLAGPYSLERYSHEIGVLLAEAELRGAVLVGFAFGAAVALEYAAKPVNDVRGVVSVGVPGASYSPYRRMAKAIRRDWPDFARKSANALFHTPQSEATLLWLESMFVSAPLPAALEALEVLASYEPESTVGKVNVPALFLHAEHDTVAPKALGQACADKAKNGRLEVLANCGHLIVLDQKDAFHEHVRAFMKTL